MASNLEAISSLLAMASNLEAMASNKLAMASNDSFLKFPSTSAGRQNARSIFPARPKWWVSFDLSKRVRVGALTRGMSSQSMRTPTSILSSISFDDFRHQLRAPAFSAALWMACISWLIGSPIRLCHRLIQPLHPLQKMQ